MFGLRSVREILTDTIDAKTIEYRGIPMRSKLEAEFAWYLDEHGFEWQYEPRKFGPPGKGYIPDFLIHERGDRCYIEIKPTIEQANQRRERMKIIWTGDPDAILLVVSGDGWWQSAAPKHPEWEVWRDHWHRYKAA